MSVEMLPIWLPCVLVSCLELLQCQQVQLLCVLTGAACAGQLPAPQADSNGLLTPLHTVVLHASSSPKSLKLAAVSL